MKTTILFIILFFTSVNLYSDFTEVWSIDLNSTATYSKSIEQIEISPDGENGFVRFFSHLPFSSMTFSDNVLVVDMNNGSTIGEIGFGKNELDISNVSYDNKHIVTIERNYDINVWDVSSLTLTRNIDSLVNFAGFFRHTNCEFSNISNKLAIASTVNKLHPDGGYNFKEFARIVLFDSDNWQKQDSIEFPYSKLLDIKFLPDRDSLSVVLRENDDLYHLYIIDANTMTIVDEKEIKNLSGGKYNHSYTKDYSYRINESSDIIVAELISSSSIYNLPFVLFMYTRNDFYINNSDDLLIVQKYDSLYNTSMIVYDMITNSNIDTLEMANKPIMFENSTLYSHNDSHLFKHTWKYPTVSIANESIEFNIYPNPFNDQLTIDLEYIVQSTKYIEVLDIMGNVVHTQEIILNSTLSILNLEALLPGTYFVKIGDRVEKVVKR